MADTDYDRINYLRRAEYRQWSSALDGASTCGEPLKKFCQRVHLYVSYVHNFKCNCEVAIVYTLKKCGGMET